MDIVAQEIEDQLLVEVTFTDAEREDYAGRDAAGELRMSAVNSMLVPRDQGTPEDEDGKSRPQLSVEDQAVEVVISAIVDTVAATLETAPSGKSERVKVKSPTKAKLAKRLKREE